MLRIFNLYGRYLIAILIIFASLLGGVEIGFVTSPYTIPGLKIANYSFLPTKNLDRDLNIFIKNIEQNKINLSAHHLNFTVKISDLGIKVDRISLKNKIRPLGKTGNPFKDMYIRYLAYKERLNVHLPFQLKEEQTQKFLKTLKEKIDRPPKDAYLDLENRIVQKEVVGLNLDITSSIKVIKDWCKNLSPKGINLIVKTKHPLKSLSQYKDLDISEVLSSYETPYNRWAKNRSFNLRLAARKINGTIIKPGETISFNKIVGERTVNYGFHLAPIIFQGELIPGVGGGTCQISSTLHAAAFFAGMDIVKRHPHSLPSRYIKMGLDATVVYPYLDLQIRNNYPYPVVIHIKVKKNVVRCEILGKKKTRKVKFLRTIVGVYPPKEKEIKDPTLPPGKKVIEKKGSRGYRVRRARLIIENGKKRVEQLSTDFYPPQPKIIKIGVAKAEKKEEQSLSSSTSVKKDEEEKGDVN